MRGFTHDRPPGRLVAAVSVVALLAATPAPSVAGGIEPNPYPADLPSFTDAWQGWKGNNFGSDTDRLYRNRTMPLLVVQWAFEDYPYRADRREAWLAERVFAATGDSVSAFFEVASGGLFGFEPATETWGAPDGVVYVDNGYDSQTEDEIGSGATIRRLLIDADPFVDYASFDTNADGVVDRTELTFLKVGGFGSCGGTRGNEPVTLDGVEVRIASAGVGVDSNLVTIEHELAHAAFGHWDMYSESPVYSSMMTAVCTLPAEGASPGDGTEELWTLPNAYSLQRMDWATTEVVTADGWVDLGNMEATRETLVLYDPALGPHDYFTVAYRGSLRGGPDRGVDQGLHVIGVNESPTVPEPMVPPLQSLTPCEDPHTDTCGAFGADRLDAADLRQPLDHRLRVNDGRWTDIWLRQVSAAGQDQMRFYVDVPGPGAMVECLDEATRATAVTVVESGSSSAVVHVRNTGGQREEITIELDLPAGWSGGEATTTIDAGERAAVSVPLTVPAGAIGGFTVAASAALTAAPGIGSTCEILLAAGPQVIPATPADVMRSNGPFRVLPRVPLDPGLAGLEIEGTLTGPFKTDPLATGTGVVDDAGVLRFSTPFATPTGNYQLFLSTSTLEEGQFTFVANPGDVAGDAPMLQTVQGTSSHALNALTYRLWLPGVAPCVALARDDEFADSLAGAALSSECPLLFTASDGLDVLHTRELATLLHSGPVTVYLLGGTGALSESVEADLASVLPTATIRRLSGPTRVETSVEVAREVVRLHGGTRLLIARASAPPDNPTAAWADSVAGGAWAAGDRLPMVVTQGESLHPAVEDLVEELSLRPVLLGSSGALSEAVAQALPDPDRVAGANRADTAAQIAARRASNPTRALIDGYGEFGWQAGFALAGYAAALNASVLLVNRETLPQETHQALSWCSPTLDDPLYIDPGGTPFATREQLEGALFGACASP